MAKSKNLKDKEIYNINIKELERFNELIKEHKRLLSAIGNL